MEALAGRMTPKISILGGQVLILLEFSPTDGQNMILG